MQEKEVERVMKGLANRRRLAILRYLRQEKKAAVGDIAEEINLSFKATSKHLGLLVAAGILDREQLGLQMFYYLAHDMPKAARLIISLL